MWLGPPPNGHPLMIAAATAPEGVTLGAPRRGASSSIGEKDHQPDVRRVLATYPVHQG